MLDIENLLEKLKNGDQLALARTLTIVENDLSGFADVLKAINPASIPVIGITGPPGAGKSTLVNALINLLLKLEKRIAILAIDPTSPFTHGSLLGDRIRMTKQFNNRDVFIRSVATRGSLGGLSAKTIEMVDVLKSAWFDYVIIETVGVGQSEIEIAGLADVKVVVLVPESGDEIQHIKSGIMEIADIFVVNKADRDTDNKYFNNLKKLAHQKEKEIPVVKTIADKEQGIDTLLNAIIKIEKSDNKQKLFLLSEKAWKLIQYRRMLGVRKEQLQSDLTHAFNKPGFNLYRFVDEHTKNS